MNTPSTWTVGPGAGPGTPNTVVAYGDPDDPLRLSVLLATALGSTPGEGQEALPTCLDPGAKWSDRLAALQVLLSKRLPDASLTVVDIDAIVPGDDPRTDPGARWSDPDFRSERLELFEALVEGADRGGLTFVRPAPTPAVTKTLVEAGVKPQQFAEEAEEGEEPSSPLEALVPLELRPVVRWLLARKRMDELELRSLLEAAGSEDPSPDIVSTALDQLRRKTLNAAYRLSLLRPAQTLNGVLGPYSIDVEDSAHSVTREDVDQLLEAGLVQRVPSNPSLVRMPRAARQMAAGRALHAQGGGLRPLHGWLARQARPEESSTPEDLLEAHHHAVLSGELDLAVDTSTYYGADLRLMGRRLGLEGRVRPEARGEAVRVFRVVVDRFDPEDAYSWEYLAYNLSRMEPPGPAEEILHAYQQAVQHDPENPLYRGRFLGFRGEIGQDIRAETRRWLTYYGTAYGALGATILGERVVEGLRRGGRADEAAELTRWLPRRYHQESRRTRA